MAKTPAKNKPTIRCPECGSTLHDVKETRSAEGVISRRRVCFNGHRFVTEERVPRIDHNPLPPGPITLMRLAVEVVTLKAQVAALSEVVATSRSLPNPKKGTSQ